MSKPPITRYALLGNGRVARDFLRRMILLDRAPCLLVLNTPARQRCTSELEALCEAHQIRCVVWDDGGKDALHELAADSGVWLLSVYFGHILSGDLLAHFHGRAVNLHPSLLPWSRGANTNIWPILDGTPAGVSLHAMVAQVDAGAVLTQVEVLVEPWDTAKTLYDKLEDAALALLLKEWPIGVQHQWPGRIQTGEGSYHTASELVHLDVIDVDEELTSRKLFDLLRARSFPPHRGLVLRIDGVAVEATLSVTPVDRPGA
jgi:methionyl-tRNA formyltransferase